MIQREREQGRPHAVPAHVQQVEPHLAVRKRDDAHGVARQIGARTESVRDAQAAQLLSGGGRRACWMRAASRRSCSSASFAAAAPPRPRDAP